MQSLLGLSHARLSPPAATPCGYTVFLLAPQSSLNRWPSFAASLALHLAIVLMIPAVAARIGPSPEEVAASRNERLMRTLRIRIPEQLYLAASGPAVERRKPFVTFKAEPPKAVAASSTPSPDRTKAAARPAFRRRLELPPVPKRVITDQVLIQPRSPAEMLPSAGLQLPELFFWAPPPPRQPLRPFVRPGHSSPPQARMRLDAPPRIEAPGPDPANLKAAVAPAARALTYAPPPSMPVRTSASENPQPAAPVADTVTGDPANVLALSTRSLPLREFVTVPPGNQVSETPGGQAGTSLSGPAGNGAGGTNASRTGTASGSGSASAGRSPGRDADSAMPTSPTAAKATPAGQGGMRPHGNGLPLETGASASSASLKAAIEATRILHPSNGVFDVVVQSSGPEGFPESAGVLSSKPVYSVFLRVGARRDWILQYCVPAPDTPALQVSGNVVHLGAPARLNAPFPITTFRPPARQRPGKYLMLHGFITADGRFEDLRPLGAHDPGDLAATFAALDGWTFRPATREGRPVRVEILLAIPSE